MLYIRGYDTLGAVILLFSTTGGRLMYPTNTIREKASLFFHILWPILVTQISYNLMTVLDTMMSGRAGTDDLAGVAVGSSLWMPVYTGLTGIMLAITPMVGQLIGNNRRSDVGRTVMQGFYLAIAISLVVLVIGAIALQPVLGIMDLSADVHTVATDYLHGLSIGIIPLFASAVLRNFFDAQGYTRVSMVILLMALPINAALNYLLIFGNFGFPELGGAGAGYATAITYWFIFGASVFLTFKLKEMRTHYLFVRWYKVSFQAWKEQLKIGVPMGLSTFFEASIFSVVTLLMGSLFDTTVIAAHQTALNFTTLMFMVPLSISIGMTIVISHEVGARRMNHAKQYAILGVSSALVIIGILVPIIHFPRADQLLLHILIVLLYCLPCSSCCLRSCTSSQMQLKRLCKVCYADIRMLLFRLSLPLYLIGSSVCQADIYFPAIPHWNHSDSGSASHLV